MKQVTYKKAISFFCILIALGSIYLIFFDNSKEKEMILHQEDKQAFKQNKNQPSKNVEQSQPSNNIKSNKNIIYVYICGAVNKPNVYKVKEGTRVFEVVKLAGGLTQDADANYINQSEVLKDEQYLYFPTKKEIKKEYTIANSAKQIQKTREKIILINLNTATKEQLMELRGIGESKALDIINYREKNSGFKKIEEIMNIQGIKQAVFNKIKDFITVN